MKASKQRKTLKHSSVQSYLFSMKCTVEGHEKSGENMFTHTHTHTVIQRVFGYQNMIKFTEDCLCARYCAKPSHA